MLVSNIFLAKIEFLEKKVWTPYFSLYIAYEEFLTKNGFWVRSELFFENFPKIDSKSNSVLGDRETWSQRSPIREDSILKQFLRSVAWGEIWWFFRPPSEAIFSKELLIQLKKAENHQISSHATLRKNGFKMLSSQIWDLWNHVSRSPRTEFDLESIFGKFSKKVPTALRGHF